MFTEDTELCEVMSEAPCNDGTVQLGVCEGPQETISKDVQVSST